MIQEATTQSIHAQSVAYDRDLDTHTNAIQEFEKIPNLFRTIKQSDGSRSQDKIWKKARLHPDGIQLLFPGNQISLSKSEYIDSYSLLLIHCFLLSMNEIGMSLN